MLFWIQTVMVQDKIKTRTQGYQYLRVMNHNMKIISFNCRSMYTKLSEIKRYVYSNKPHVICFTKTWLVNDRLPNFINYRGIWKNRQGLGGGLDFLGRSNVTVLPSNIVYIYSQLEVQNITIPLKHTIMDIMNIYNPVAGTPFIYIYQFSFQGIYRKLLQAVLYYISCTFLYIALTACIVVCNT
jgi:exonuclease III